jgi:hypothetical protein
MLPGVEPFCFDRFAGQDKGRENDFSLLPAEAIAAVDQFFDTEFKAHRVG